VEVLLILIAVVCSAAGTFGVLRAIERAKRRGAENEAEQIISRAKLDAENVLREGQFHAKEAALKIQSEAEKGLLQTRDELRDRERQLEKQQDQLNRRAEDLSKQNRGLENTQRRLAQQLDTVNKRAAELDKLRQAEQEALQRISGMNKEEAKERLLKSLETELEQDVGAQVLRFERRVAEDCEAKARDMLLTAMQRYAAAHTAEHTTSTVDIPNDEVKGRIIGREGRNIRAFEKATGVDVIIDDTPGVIIVSGFDPVRREVARLSLQSLIADGRIHPSRIEEVVHSTEKEIDTLIRKKGREAIEEVGLTSFPDKLIDMIGRLHFRTSYSQNLLRHSIEVAFLTGMLAEMIGLDGDLARRCGLLHDIGKAADHELEGGHPKIGADMLQRFHQAPEVIHAALGHHDQIVTEYPYTMLVATADACSASRPGARRESLERYIKRMEELESIALGFEGVDQAFAIQAGRELRVIVNAEKIDDGKAAVICRNIARSFEQQLTYPGEIKVTVIRENRITEIAR
jgi:ribonuclease Y